MAKDKKKHKNKAEAPDEAVFLDAMKSSVLAAFLNPVIRKTIANAVKEGIKEASIPAKQYDGG